MIELNLTSPEQRLRLKHELAYSRLLLTVAVVGLLLIVVVIGLFSLHTLLANHSLSLDGEIANAELQLARSTDAETNDRVNAINRTLTGIADVQDEYTKWTPIILDLAHAVPDGITLTSLTLSETGVELFGSAAHRDDLLTFKDQLIASGRFAPFTIPLSSLVKREDVPFQITTTITTPVREETTP